MKSIPWLGLMLWLGIAATHGCDINHNLAGDAYIHVVPDGSCAMQDDTASTIVDCADGRQLVCLPLEAAGQYACQRFDAGVPQ